MSSAPLVGRDRDLTVLRDALDSARDGMGSTVVIEGEPGIGKSRLLQELVEAAAADRVTALMTGCDIAEQTAPFAPVVRLLGVDALSYGDAEDAEDPSAAPGLRFRAIEAIGAKVELLAGGGPILLVIDDLQWADESTLHAVRSIASRIGPLPVSLVLAHRSGHRIQDLHHLTDHLARRGAHQVHLDPLDDAAVADLASALLGGVPDADLLERLRGAGGNPLFIGEFVHAVADAPPDETAEGGESTPRRFRRAVLRRIGQLPPEVQEALRVASILGTSFAPSELSSALGWSPMQLAAVVEQATAGGTLEERQERLAFRHDLVREAVYENIPAGVRRDLHNAVWQRLSEAGADVLVVAHHVALGASAIDDDAARWLRRAAADAAPHAPEVAAELLCRARTMLPPSSPELSPLLAELAVAYAWSGRFAEAESLCRDVLAGRVDSDTALTLRSGLLRARTWQGQAGEVLADVGLRADEEVDGPAAAVLAAETALAALLSYDFPTAAPAAARAELLARAHASDVALCQALGVQTWVNTFLGRPTESVDLAEEAISLADASVGGAAHRAHPHFFIAMPLILLDRLDEAARNLQRGRHHAADRGLVWSLPLFHAHLGATKFVAGEWDAAVAELEAGFAITDEIGYSSMVGAAASAWLAAIQIHRDDISAAERTVSAALGRLGELAPPVPLLNWARALLQEAQGSLDHAIELLQVAWNMFMAGANITDPWSAMTLVRLCVQTGEADRAEALLPVIERQATITRTAFMQAQALRCQGLVRGDVDLLLAAVTAYRSCPRPLELAAGCEDAGAALATASRTDEGLPLLEEALEQYERIGAARDAARVRSVLRQHGVRRSGPRRVARATVGWESLTDTERRVVDLVAQRLSNPEVAERLFISRHTVESHLKHIYRKLDLSSRLELAAEAARH